MTETHLKQEIISFQQLLAGCFAYNSYMHISV